MSELEDFLQRGLAAQKSVEELTQPFRDDFYVQLGARVKDHRLRMRLTQTALAAQVGLGRTSVSNIEAGRTHSPVHVVAALAEALGVTFTDLTPEMDVSLAEPATVGQLVAATTSQLRTMLQLDGICDHCAHEALGNAGVNDDVLCHPDEGMDCYRLVTVYHHATPCRGCYEARLTFNRL